MYAIVEFFNNNLEPSGEVSIVPLIWVQKNETKCYWPVRTNKKPFQEFVRDLTPYKKSWPSYHIKVIFKTSSYETAEKKLSMFLADQVDSSESSKSLCQKQIDCNFDSDSENASPEITLTEKNGQLVHSQHENAVNDSIVFTSSPKRPSRIENVEVEKTSHPIEHSKLISSLEERRFLSLKSSETRSPTSALPSHITAEHSKIAHSTEFENLVLSTLSKIANTVDQNSILLNEVNIRTNLMVTNKLIPPESVPQKFPLDSLEQFQAFELEISKDSALWNYMVKRLAALGGAGQEHLTRRILKFLLTNEVAVLYNWKGRDKLAFEKLKTMDMILAAAKTNYGADINELKIANAVKDWLKYAKLRMSVGEKKRLNQKNV